jgi:hypothetical protein
VQEFGDFPADVQAAIGDFPGLHRQTGVS